MYFAVYNEASGELVSTGTVVADADHLAKHGLSVVELEAPPAPGDKRWNPKSRKFDLPPAAAGAVNVADLLATDAEFGALPAATRDKVVGIVRRIIGLA